MEKIIAYIIVYGILIVLGIIAIYIIYYVVGVIRVSLKGKKLKALAEQGDPRAQFDFGVWCIQENRLDAAIDWLEKSLDQGYLDAKSKLKACRIVIELGLKKKAAVQRIDEEETNERFKDSAEKIEKFAEDIETCKLTKKLLEGAEESDAKVEGLKQIPAHFAICKAQYFIQLSLVAGFTAIERIEALKKLSQYVHPVKAICVKLSKSGYKFGNIDAYIGASGNAVAYIKVYCGDIVPGQELGGISLHESLDILPTYKNYYWIANERVFIYSKAAPPEAVPEWLMVCLKCVNELEIEAKLHVQLGVPEV